LATGQRRFVQRQPVALEQAKVGGHAHSAFQLDHVARDHLFGRHLARQPAAADPRELRDHRAQRAGAGLGPPFLKAPDERVEHEDPEDEQGVAHVADQQRQDRGHEQQIDQRAGELAQEHAQRRGAPGLGDPVRSNALEPLLRFGLRQARRLAGESGQDLRRRHGVPRGGNRECGRVDHAGEP
jgi:hypothetical protein